MSDSKPKIFVTRLIPENGLKLLEKDFDLKVRRESTPIPRNELLAEIKDCDWIITILSDKIDAEVMDNAPKLKIISNFAVGIDNIDINEATKRKIAVGNTPNVLTQSTAELALALIVAVAKRITEGNEIMKENLFPGWGPMYMLGMELLNKTVGVIGYGRIGKKLAEMMHKAFNCRIIYVDSSPDTEANPDNLGEKVTLDYLLENADIISLHVPLFPHTRHLIGEKELKKMKKTAILVNTARGHIVDEQALGNALQNNQIAGAGLDVFEFEPKRLDGLEKLKNIVMTPHVGSATSEARSQMAEVAAKNIIGILIEGQSPISIVNNL